MQKILLIFMSLIVMTSCNDSKSSNKRLLSQSSGKINNLSVVVDNELWEGQVGETLRNILAAPVHGLPQDEPLFILSQLPPVVFTGFARQSRIVLKIEKSDSAKVKIAKDLFARPQRVVVVTGKTDEEISQQLRDNAGQIVMALKNEEIKEQQRRIKLSLHKNNTIKENLGISINFPSAYRIATEEGKFYWIRKDITTGTTNVLLYELPYGSIKDNDSVVGQIIKIRDSIGKKHIPGPLDGSFMITEDAYTPFLAKTTINDKFAYETRGIWDVKNAFMSGPFVNYIIDDKANNRLLVVEGFAFAPSVSKRDYMFELEAIIKSIKFN
ncbi:MULTISPECIES: DUF4837 family protein [Bizionia]|uniref:DUF4837 family protein n=1 Tax=Bizionia algoritergicola TaxID=291187 RepID=A0A5D0R3F3_9FLAO|nr:MULTISPECIES: DUF4837 family protein [Bizionia]OBX21662.1 DUF4837 domain-containing protein [Bizionia sp. APA-3]TYB75094.1 DUF4837 family protein [Bizionia algoritergicola]